MKVPAIDERNRLSPTAEFPLRLGPPHHFAKVRSIFRDVRFNDQRVCEVLKIPEMSDLGSVDAEHFAWEKVPLPLSLLLKLFLFLKHIPRGEFEDEFDIATIESFLAIDLIRCGSFDGDCYFTPVFLYPVAGLVIASDRRSNPDGSPFQATDIVFPAIYVGTLRFLQLFSNQFNGEVLDLCAGSGIGALVMSRTVNRAVSTDITARATHFAQFNKLLNGRENVEILQSDLFTAVQGRKFDHIVAHPPYIPSLGDAAIFRDGGETGEKVVHRIIENLPDYLKPGGTFTTLCLGHDTKEGRFEERAREWLGKFKNEFDIIFAQGDERSPSQAIRDIDHRARGLGNDSLQRLQGIFMDMHTTKVVYGALVLHRHTDRNGQSWTVRKKLDKNTTGENFNWLFMWRHRIKEIGFVDQLVHTRLRLAKDVQLQSTYVVHEGGFVPASFIFESKTPFQATTECDPWIVPLIARFNGSTTPSEIYSEARLAEEMPVSFHLDDFANLLMMLIERGCLVLEESSVLSTNQ